MTDDQLADYFKAGFDQLHARIDAQPDGPRKRRAQRLVRIMHGAANELKDLAVDGGMIQPFSGGDPNKTDP